MTVTFHPRGMGEPSLNITNHYASVPLELMGLVFSPVGDLANSELYEAKLRLLAAIDDEATLLDHVEPTVTVGNVTVHGRDLDDIREYARTMVRVLEACLEANEDLVWS